jgi:hypothetical protein
MEDKGGITMGRKNNRYLQFERYMTVVLGIALLIFIIFLIASGTGTLWLKVTTAIMNILLTILCLAYMYLTGELLRRRSLWMSTIAAAILICTLFSLILQFPSPIPGT